jgi:hypothetical protein
MKTPSIINKGRIKRDLKKESIDFHISLAADGGIESAGGKSDIEEFDIEIDKSLFRIYIDKSSNKIWCREIEYDSASRVLFKNPANKEKSEWIKEVLFKLPENQWLDTLRDVRNGTLKKKKEIRQKKKSKPRGRPEKENIKEATLWCIAALDNKTYKNRPEAIKEAFKEFGEKDVPLKSFARTVGAKIANIAVLYREKLPHFKDKNTRHSFAKKLLFPSTPRKHSMKTKKKE